MENDNETVEQACESICELVIAIHDKEHNEKQDIKNAWHILQQVKDRLLAAHNRVMAGTASSHSRGSIPAPIATRGSIRSDICECEEFDDDVFKDNKGKR